MKPTLFVLLTGFCVGGTLAVSQAGEVALIPETPASMAVDFKLPQRPFLMLSPEEMAADQSKIQTKPWAKEAMREFMAEVDKINAKPNLFPTGEGGWPHLYISPDTGAKLRFDPDQPHEHYCPETKMSYTGEALDAAWRTESMGLTATQQQKLAAAYLLTGDKKYAETMKRVFLDIADKYANYRRHDRSMTHFGDQAEPIAGIATSQSIEECDLLTSLAFSYDTLAGSGVLSAAEKAEIETKLWKRGIAYMYRIMELHPSGGNWWIWQACGATVLGVTFGDQKLVALGLNTPDQGVLSMFRSGYVNEDGFTGELSPGYHAYPFRALIRMALATRRVGIDFYKLDRFKKMFDLPIAISLPDLTLPRLNDGSQNTLASDDWASVYELGLHLYGDPAYGDLLHAIYTAPAAGVKRNSVNALLYGEDLPTAPFGDTASSFLSASGLSILRSPLNDWNCILKDDFGNSGHRHPDALNLVLYANGEDAFPGTGSPPYGSPYYLQWFSQTIGHNTVTLNTQSQSLSLKEKAVEYGLSDGGMAAAQASAGDVQDKKSKNASPVILRRSVVMTPHAIIDIFRIAPKTDAPADAKETLPADLVDWALHMNGTLSIDGKLEKSEDQLIPADRLNAEGNGHLWPHQGYKFIQNLQEVDSTGVIQGKLSQPHGGKVDFWLSPRGASDKIYQATGVGFDTSMDKGLPMLLQRRSTNETAFTAAYAPYRKSPQVQSVSFAGTSPDGREVVVEVTHKNGRDLVLSLPQPGHLAAGDAVLEGSLGCISDVSPTGKKLLLVGQGWKDGDLDLSLKASGQMVLEKDGNHIRIHNAAATPLEGTLKCKSLHLEKSFVIPPQTDITY